MRELGKTTQQMQSAPRHSIYIWPTRCSMGYAKHLAQSLGRDDLVLVTPEWLDSQRWRGLTLYGIVVDHAVWLTPKQRIHLDSANFRISTLLIDTYS